GGDASKGAGVEERGRGGCGHGVCPGHHDAGGAEQSAATDGSAAAPGERSHRRGRGAAGHQRRLCRKRAGPRRLRAGQQTAAIRTAQSSTAETMTLKRSLLALLAGGIAGLAGARAEVDNLKVVTDASPDYSDMDSLIHSVTANWQTPEEKCWAMF